jgi:hypothetical protein
LYFSLFFFISIMEVVIELREVMAIYEQENEQEKIYN